jgi:hypothetical protein
MQFFCLLQSAFCFNRHLALTRFKMKIPPWNWM